MNIIDVLSPYRRIVSVEQLDPFPGDYDIEVNVDDNLNGAIRQYNRTKNAQRVFFGKLDDSGKPKSSVRLDKLGYRYDDITGSYHVVARARFSGIFDQFIFVRKYRLRLRGVTVGTVSDKRSLREITGFDVQVTRKQGFFFDRGKWLFLHGFVNKLING